MIEGINIRCNVGGVEVLRSPRIVLTLRRRAVVSTCEVDIPDADGSVQVSLAKKQAVRVRFGHRGEGGTWHDWSGTVKDFQPAGPDTIRVQAVGLEQALIDTTVTEAMHGEPADVVARRLLVSTGLPVAGITIPAETFPHIVFSNVTVARPSNSLPPAWNVASGTTFPGTRSGWGKRACTGRRGRTGGRVCGGKLRPTSYATTRTRRA